MTERRQQFARVFAALAALVSLHVARSASRAQGAVRDTSGSLSADAHGADAKKSWLQQRFAGSTAELSTYVGTGSLYTSGYRDPYVSNAFYLRPQYNLGTRYKFSCSRAAIYVEDGVHDARHAERPSLLPERLVHLPQRQEPLHDAAREGELQRRRARVDPDLVREPLRAPHHVAGRLGRGDPRLRVRPARRRRQALGAVVDAGRRVLEGAAHERHPRRRAQATRPGAASTRAANGLHGRPGRRRGRSVRRPAEHRGFAFTTSRRRRAVAWPLLALDLAHHAQRVQVH